MPDRTALIDFPVSQKHELSGLESISMTNPKPHPVFISVCQYIKPEQARQLLAFNLMEAVIKENLSISNPKHVCIAAKGIANQLPLPFPSLSSLKVKGRLVKLYQTATYCKINIQPKDQLEIARSIESSWEELQFIIQHSCSLENIPLKQSAEKFFLAGLAIQAPTTRIKQDGQLRQLAKEKCILFLETALSFKKTYYKVLLKEHTAH